MLGARLLQLIQSHARSLTIDVINELKTNERTPTFRRLNPSDLESRVTALYWNLGQWIGGSDDEALVKPVESNGQRMERDEAVAPWTYV